MNGGTQGFPRHEVSDKQEVLFEDVSPSTAFSIRQLDITHEFSGYIKREEKKNGLSCTRYGWKKETGPSFVGNLPCEVREWGACVWLLMKRMCKKGMV